MIQPSMLKSHKLSQMIQTHFYRLYSIMTGSKIIAGSPSKKAPNFEAVVSVLLQICGQIAGVCHIGEFLLKKLSHYLGK